MTYKREVEQELAWIMFPIIYILITGWAFVMWLYVLITKSML